MELIQTEKLKREVINNNGFIELKTEFYKEFMYAFHLHHINGKEQVKYSDESKFISNIKFGKGFYRAAFLYKDKSDKRRMDVLFFFIGDKNKVEVISSDLQSILDHLIEPIIEKEGYKIDYYNIGSSKTFVVFNGKGSLKSSPAFGLSFLIKNGFNVITCLQNNNQYQELSFEDMRKYVYPFVKDYDTYLYGSSLGGYCALYYAGALNGTVIAGAPRNSAHPILQNNISEEFKKELKIDSLFNQLHFKHSSFDFNPKTDKKIYIFIDPYVEADVFFVEKLIENNFSGLNLINCEYAGHEVLYHLNKTNQLKKIVEDIVKKKEPIVEVIDSCYTDFGKAKEAFIRRDYQSALIFCEKSMQEKSMKQSIRNRLDKLHRNIIGKLNIQH